MPLRKQKINSPKVVHPLFRAPAIVEWRGKRPTVYSFSHGRGAPLSEAVDVEMSPGEFHAVHSIGGLAEMLVAENWPKKRGRAYYAALHACLNCLEDQASDSKIARNAFLAAAKDAGVLVRPNRSP
jgi:Protein of unknown function (DUF982)